MNDQHKQIEALYELTKKHPDLPVVYCYHQDFTDPEFTWMTAEELKIRVGWVFSYSDSKFIDREDIIDKIHGIKEDMIYRHTKGSTILRVYRYYIRSGELKKAIIVEVIP